MKHIELRNVKKGDKVRVIRDLSFGRGQLVDDGTVENVVISDEWILLNVSKPGAIAFEYKMIDMHPSVVQPNVYLYVLD